MRKTTDVISVCPKHCDANFVAKAKVQQKWEVNAFGEMLFCREEDLGTELDTFYGMECSKCGSTARDVDCIGIPVQEDGLVGKLLIPTNLSEEGFVYWSPRASSNIVSCPIDYSKSKIPQAAIQDWTLFMAPADAMSEDRDGVTFLAGLGTDLILYLRGPRAECEGQISL